MHQGGAFGVCGQHCVDQRHVGRWNLLGHAADLGTGRQRNVAGVQPQFTANNLEQRGFTRTITAHKAHFVAFGNDGAGFLKQGAAFDGVVDF